MAMIRSRDLRTGEAVWSAYPMPRVEHSSLSSDQRADVAIVGAGISGAMVAQEISAMGLSVIILDKRGPMRGSTAATTALAQYDLDVPIGHLAKKIGIGNAVRAWKRSMAATENLAGRLDMLRIECDLVRVPSVQLSGNVLDTDEMKKEHALRVNNGFPMECLGRKMLKERFGIDREAALVSSGDLQMHPLKMTAGFLQAAIHAGCRIHAPVEVKDIDVGREGLTLLTDVGSVVRAKHVVFATGYEVLKHVKAPGHRVHSTYAIATRPQPELIWPERAMIWEAADPYLYIRCTPDGRVICGGEDEEFQDEEARDALLPEKTITLQRKLKELFPRLDVEAEHSWTGSFGSSTTGMPSIGKVPGMKNCHAILAFGGNGMVFSKIAAEVIGAAIMGGRDGDEDLFAFQSQA